jgi:phosphate-selective porin OprO/OprP
MVHVRLLCICSLILCTIGGRCRADMANDSVALLQGESSVQGEPDVTTPTSPATTQPTFRWNVAWEGWDGLQIDLSDRLLSPTELLGLTTRPDDDRERTRFSMNIGGRLEIDAGAYDTTGDLFEPDATIKIRRALLDMTGMFRFVVPIDYKVEFGYIPGQFYVNELYLLFPDLDYVGTLKVGFFKPPQGLDRITSSRDITFMEPASTLQALATGNEAGIQIGHPVFDQRMTWNLGIFGNGDNFGEYGNASKNYGNVIGRLTWLAIDHLNPEHPQDNGFLHFGVSANYQYSTTSTVRYRSRPESYLPPYIIDTGEINASSASTFGLEAAWVGGPWTVQAEGFDTPVTSNVSGTLNFSGFYVLVSRFITDDSRAYNPTTAAFSRVIPHDDFQCGKSGWGAVELGVRCSYTDLSDGTVSGGRLSMLGGELNWYLQPHLRWMFNAEYGHVTGSPAHGDIWLIQTRLGIDF